MRSGRGFRAAPPLALLMLAVAAVAPAAAIVGPSRGGGSLAPFVVMVLNHVGRTAGYCSGLVIGPRAVLTAAHCVPPGAAVKVHYRDDAGAPVLLDIAAIARNPGYASDAIKARTRSIDLAVVELVDPLPDRFRAAPRGDIRAAPAGTAFRLAGYGLSREGEAASAGTLRVADVVARDPVSSVLLWARGPAGAGACTGDSGGPVFASTSDTAVAIMAWSAGEGHSACGTLTQALWIGPQTAWIEATLSAWGLGKAP